MNGAFLVIYMCCIVAVSGDCDKIRNNARFKLVDKILCGYDKEIRPKSDQGVKVGLKMLILTVNFDPHRNLLDANLWIFMVWKDDHLKWTPSDYEGIEYTHINSEQIWVPDLSVYNRHDQSGTPHVVSSIRCLVYNTGAVVCVVPTKTEAICRPELKRFPFDYQNCSLRYGSWVHSGEEVNFILSKDSISVEEYYASGEWELVNATATKHEGKYSCCPNSTYPTLIYDFWLKRHSGAQVCIVVIPAIALIVMTMVSLCLEHTAAERMYVICCNIITHLLYLQYLSWQLPISGPDPPLLIIFSRDSFILVIFMMILTAIQRKLTSLKKSSPPLISSLVGNIMSFRPLQIILVLDDNMKVFANRLRDEDSANIIENSENEPKNKDWIILSRILDKVVFLIYALIYFFMFIAFIP